MSSSYIGGLIDQLSTNDWMPNGLAIEVAHALRDQQDDLRIAKEAFKEITETKLDDVPQELAEKALEALQE